VNIIL